MNNAKEIEYNAMIKKYEEMDLSKLSRDELFNVMIEVTNGMSEVIREVVKNIEKSEN